MKMLYVAALVASAAVSAPAQGAIWILNDVVFTDGATATGFFDYDSTTRTFGDFSISVTAGPDFSDLTYDGSNSAAITYLANGTRTFNFGLNGSWREIRLEPDAELTEAGGTIALRNSGQAAECFNCSPFRSYASPGFLTSVTAAVPEPATWAMMIGGCGLVGGAMRRSRQTTSITYA